MAELVLLRHGETAWSAAGRHTSRTELPLTARGERQASRLRALCAGWDFAAVWSSPRKRARQTAALAGLTVDQVTEDLAEWDYGDYEGITTPDIRRERSDWDLWRDGCPGGEAPDDVAARADRVLAALTAPLGVGDVAVVAHGHLLRVLAARWLGLTAAHGALLRLDVATVSTLGHERERRVVTRWNSPS